MKQLLALVISLSLLTGCGIFPKTVEFFQKKVKPMPEISDAAHNRQRQAAEYIAHEYPTNRLAGALSTSLGPPLKPWQADPGSLADRLLHDRAILDVDLSDYSRQVDEVVGKKIEGTGLFQIGYFTYIGCFIVLGLLIWFGVKVYGMFNPIVGTASGVVGRAASSVLGKGFSELVSGGQQFLKWVEPAASGLSVETANWIKNTFKIAQQTAQSADTQKVVNTLIVPSVPNQKAPGVAPTTALPSANSAPVTK